MFFNLFFFLLSIHDAKQKHKHKHRARDAPRMVGFLDL